MRDASEGTSDGEQPRAAKLETRRPGGSERATICRQCRAKGEMRECLLLLMRGQRVLDKGVELVRVWMLPGLEKFAHSCLDAAAAIRCRLL